MERNAFKESDMEKGRLEAHRGFTVEENDG